MPSPFLTHLIAKTASELDARFERSPEQSVRQYVLRLVKELDLDPNVADDYINMYELARFGLHDVTESDFSEFSQVFTELLDAYVLFWIESPFSRVAPPGLPPVLARPSVKGLRYRRSAQ